MDFNGMVKADREINASSYRKPVKQAVIFPSDELSRIRKENKIMRDALEKIAAKELFPDKCVQLYEYQSCKSIAEEAIEEIEGD